MNYSRWASIGDIKEITEAVNLKTGVTKSGLPVMYDSKFAYLNTHEAHNLVIGCTGSGKTQTTILPMLKFAMMAGESIVVHDPKGELYVKLAQKLEEEGYKNIVLDFDDSRLGNSWNPLTLAYKLYKENNKDKALEMVDELGYYLFADTQRQEADPFWTNSTINYFSGLAIYLFENAKEEEVNLCSINSLANNLNDNETAKKFVDKLDKTGVVFMKVSGILQSPPETRGSILSVFNQKIARFLSKENLKNMLSYSDFDISTISNDKTAVFIVSGLNNHTRNLLPLFVDQVINVVSIYGNQVKRLNVLLDEFDSLIPIRDFALKLNHCRSLNIRVTINIQSFSHLKNMYSTEDVDILKMCFGNIIYLLSEDNDTLEEISKACGMVNAETPLISTTELKTLAPFETVILMTRMMPFRTKLTPDYMIDWGYETKAAEITCRKDKEIKIFKLEK